MNVQLIAGAAATALLFGSGWQARSWYEDSKDLAQVEATKKAIEAFEQYESRVAATVEEKLRGLRANERVIEKWRTEVVDRPIYHVECIDDDGLRLIESYATGKTTGIISEMPRNTPPPDG